jgi:hypothetical protein
MLRADHLYGKFASFTEKKKIFIAFFPYTLFSKAVNAVRVLYNPLHSLSTCAFMTN